MKKIFYNFFPDIILTLVVAVFFLANYTPGTFLMGWDNVQVDLNPVLGLKRSFYGVWQEYQGLGLLGGMSHSADLIRSVLIYFASKIIPQAVIRYAYHFVMLLMGGIGSYKLINYLLGEKNLAGKITGLTGAFFYLFNLATLQIFYVPYEPMSAHFAFLPWFLFLNLKFIDSGKRLTLLLLIIFNLLATPQSYVGTIFIVFTVFLSIIFLFKALTASGTIRRILICFLVLFLANAFWLLPNIYFIVNKASVNINSKSNQMVTEENILKNKKFGNFGNAALLKGFWFDNMEIDEKGLLHYQMGIWRNHMQKSIYPIIGYFMFTVSVSGMIIALKNRRKELYPFIVIFIVSFSIIANATPVLKLIPEFLSDIPLIKQAFRTPFTKFSISVSLIQSIFFSVSSLYLYFWFKDTKRWWLSAILLLLPVIYVYPMLTGNLFYRRVKTRFPEEYFKMFKYFSQANPNSRIANFPQYTYWGWSFYRWNYSGSGFIWYGIEQPVLDRTFDVWSRENENYYHELSYAVYSGDSNLFENTLEKYQIDWLLLDRNIVSFSNAKELYWDKIYFILATLNAKISLEKKYSNLEIYKVNLHNKTEDFIFAPKNPLHTVDPVYQWNNNDTGFAQYGNYYSAAGDTGIYYPFRTLFTGRNQDDIEFSVEQIDQEIIFSGDISEKFSKSNLYLPPLSVEDYVFVTESNQIPADHIYPQVYLNNQLIPYDVNSVNGNYIFLGDKGSGQLQIKIPITSGLYSYDNMDENAKSLTDCNLLDGSSNGYVENIINKSGWKRLSSFGRTVCLSLQLPQLAHKLSYLVSVTGNNQAGRSLFFSIINRNSDRSDLETYLSSSFITGNSYYIIPPMEKFGSGYNFVLKNISVGNIRSVNEIGRIIINPVPYKFLNGIKLISDGNLKINKNSGNNLKVSVSHTEASIYNVESDANAHTIVLSQSFDKGWKLYRVNCNGGLLCNVRKSVPFLFLETAGKHVLVNNWENGWIIPKLPGLVTVNYVILYLPQYLEYAGLLLWLILPAALLLVPVTHSEEHN